MAASSVGRGCKGKWGLIRIPSNPRLSEEIAHLLTRPVGRPPNRGKSCSACPESDVPDGGSRHPSQNVQGTAMPDCPPQIGSGVSMDASLRSAGSPLKKSREPLYRIRTKRTNRPRTSLWRGYSPWGRQNRRLNVRNSLLLMGEGLILIRRTGNGQITQEMSV